LSKIVALYINEMIKIWKKLSTIVLVCIMIVGIILIGVFAGKKSKNLY
jgi:hypothetical protein